MPNIDKLKKILEKSSKVKGDVFVASELVKLEERIDKVEEKLADKEQVVTKVIEELKGEDGRDGEDYVLTDEDKKEIASLIEVPVVEKVIEKVETIVEQPTIYSETIEVENDETGEEIVEKINDLPINNDKYKIDASHIKNLPTTNFTGGGSTARNLYQLMDVSIDNPTSGDLLQYNGTSWFNTPNDKLSSVNTDSTLTGLGTTASALGINLNNANTWTATQTFDRIKANTVQAVGSGGLLFESNSGTDIALFGAGGGAGVTFYDGVILNTMTQGSVFFAGSSGLISQDNANFYYDSTNVQLKIGSNSVVNGSVTNPIAIAKTSTSYLATYIQNLSSGTAASTDLIIGNNADDGTVSTGTYLDMGINSSGYTGSGLTNGPGDAYIFNNLEDLIIGTGTAGKNVIIGTNIFGGTAASKTRATFTDTNVQFLNGSASAPSIVFASSTTTGLYRGGTDILGFSIAGTARLTHSATTWSLNSSNGGTLDIGGTAQYMDFGGTITTTAATTQAIRTAITIAPDVNRTNIFGINNTTIIGGSVTGLTLTTMSANRAANQFSGSVGITVTTASAFDARDINNTSSGTVSVTNNYGFYVSQVQTGGATINAAFAAINTANSTRWNLYMSGTAQNYLEGSTGIGISVPTAKLHVVQSSLGTSVLKLVSTATNDDPTKDFAQGRVTTNNATITTVQTIATTTDTTLQIKAEVIGRRTGGTGGTAGDGAGYFIVGTFKNIGGTVTQIGTTTNVHVVEDQAGWGCVFTISGTNILVQITGATNNNVVWHCHADYKQVGT